jgi:hypothetical protein
VSADWVETVRRAFALTFEDDKIRHVRTHRTV